MARSIRLIVALTLGAGLLGFGLSQLQPKQYLGVARLHMSYPDEGSDAPRDPQRRLNDLAARVTTAPVLERAAQQMGADAPSVAELAEKVSAHPSEALDIIEVRARDSSSQGAASIANEVAGAFQEVTANSRAAAARAAVENLDRFRSEIQERLDAASQRLNDSRAAMETEVNRTVAASPANLRAQALEDRLESDSGYLAAVAEREAALNQLRDLTTRTQEITLDAAATGSGVDLAEPASVATEPVSPKPIRSAFLACVVGLVISAALAWLREVNRESSLQSWIFRQLTT